VEAPVLDAGLVGPEAPVRLLLVEAARPVFRLCSMPVSKMVDGTGFG